MDIAKFAVARPVAVTMRTAALVLLGAISLGRLPVDLLPRVTLPTVAVVTQWPNVAPEEIEAEITRPIEAAVSSASNLYQVNSSTVEGSSTAFVQFQWGTDIGQAAVDVLQLIERARQSFPSDPTLGTQVPMAAAVIGGLMTSTFLTLFVAPTAYTLLDDASRFLRRETETGS